MTSANSGTATRMRRLPLSITDEEIDKIRLAAREAVEAASLRKVAPEIGIGHSTLANFLSGARPHPRVRRILHNWNVNRKGPPEHAAELDRLLRELPEHIRVRIRPVLARVLCRGYSDARIGVPQWLKAAATSGQPGYAAALAPLDEPPPRLGQEGPE